VALAKVYGEKEHNFRAPDETEKVSDTSDLAGRQTVSLKTRLGNIRDIRENAESWSCTKAM